MKGCGGARIITGGNGTIGNGGKGIARWVLALQAGKDRTFHCLGAESLTEIILQNGRGADFQEKSRAPPRCFRHRMLKVHGFAQVAPPIFGPGFRPG